MYANVRDCTRMYANVRECARMHANQVKLTLYLKLGRNPEIDRTQNECLCNDVEGQK